MLLNVTNHFWSVSPVSLKVTSKKEEEAESGWLLEPEQFRVVIFPNNGRKRDEINSMNKTVVTVNVTVLFLCIKTELVHF
jgi:hypothetical protein